MRTLLTTYRYEIIAAVSGAIVMILELVGARMVAPYFGTSIYVWTAMIGVILGALSAGYWYGGRLADRRASDTRLMKIIVLAAGTIFVTVSVQDSLLGSLAGAVDSARIGSLLGALILFSTPALLLGIVSPYVVRLRLSSLVDAGRSVGRLSAAGTFGSIVGTFLAGYWLIGLFGNRSLGFGLVLALVALSFFVTVRPWVLSRAAIALLALGGMTTTNYVASSVILDVDSAYSRYLVTESGENNPIRSLLTDPVGTQSAQLVGQPDVMVLEYTQRFKTVSDAVQPSTMLVIGGGAYSFPAAVARQYPDTQVDVVEIDPLLTDISEEYFGLQAYDNLKIFHEDGRVFLNRAEPKQPYDLLFMDAFSALTPPYQLATRQSVAHQSRILAKDGAVVANVIAPAQPGPYISAVIATYRSVFEQVEVYQVDSFEVRKSRQNLIVIASHDAKVQDRIRSALGSKPVQITSSKVLTDDYAPVEQLIDKG